MRSCNRKGAYWIFHALALQESQIGPTQNGLKTGHNHPGLAPYSATLVHAMMLVGGSADNRMGCSLVTVTCNFSTTILYEIVGTFCNKNSVPRSPKSRLSKIVHCE